MVKITPHFVNFNQLDMRILYLLCIVVATTNHLFSQKVKLQWSRAIGGSADEAQGLSTLNVTGRSNTSIAVAPDSSIYLATYSRSADGFVKRNRGENDIFVVKLSPTGDTLWTRTFGGPAEERLYQVVATPDGGCLLAGSTLSRTQDFQTNFQGFNGFVIKLNANGSTAFTRICGGNGDDQVYGINYTSDGGFIIVGESSSIDGDLVQAGSSPGLAWVMKCNATGVREWARIVQSYNTADAIEAFWRVAQAPDGSYIVGGFGSNNFNNPDADEIMIVKYSSGGIQQWRKLIGSTRGDGIGNIIPKPDNSGYWLTGRVSFSGGNVANYNGGPGDVWWVDLDANGNIIKEKTFGGTDWEFAYDMTMDEQKRLYIAGFTRSTGGVAGTGFGIQDFWVLVVDTLGDTIATYRLGGSANDVLQGIAMGPNKKWFVLSGRTDSNNIPGTTSYNGARDAWVARLFLELPVDTSITRIENRINSHHSSSVWYDGDDRYLKVGADFIKSQYQIINADGKLIYKGLISEQKTKLPKLKNGLYTLLIIHSEADKPAIIRFMQ